MMVNKWITVSNMISGRIPSVHIGIIPNIGSLDNEITHLNLVIIDTLNTCFAKDLDARALGQFPWIIFCKDVALGQWNFLAKYLPEFLGKDCLQFLGICCLYYKLDSFNCRCHRKSPSTLLSPCYCHIQSWNSGQRLEH